MAAQTTNQLARVRYWQGQLLTAEDLGTQLAADEELRRLHNRAVHEAYGVAVGLGATVEGQQLKLECGTAYDCAGRALVLREERTLDLPEDARTLVLSHDPASPDGVALAWKPQNEVNPNREIALARLSADTPDRKLDPAFLPVVARPMARPRIATGETIKGQTPWGENENGVEVLIDTSAAGFTRTPHYFAEVLVGNKKGAGAGEAGGGPATQDDEKDFPLAWFASIADPSTQGFTFRLMLRRITRAALDIVSPMARLAQPPPQDGLTLTLSDKGILPGDLVARLLPLAGRASVVKSKSANGKTATLEVPLPDLTKARLVAYGNPPRLARVTEAPTPDTFFEITVDTPDNFGEGAVVVRLADAEQTLPAKVESVDDDTLLLLTTITNLAVKDTLAVAQDTTAVKTIDGANKKLITVDNPAPFTVNDVVVRLGDAVETSAPAKIAEKKPDGTLVLSQEIANLQVGSRLGIARAAGRVLSIEDNTGQFKIVVDNAERFSRGDIVAQIRDDGTPSIPVRVVALKKNENRLTLSAAIPDLEAQDTIGAADFRVRATVLSVSGTGDTDVEVNDSAPFAQQGATLYVARIDDLLSASLPSRVIKTADKKLTLDKEIAGLKKGDVLGLCAFPASARVDAVADERNLSVSPAGVLRVGDVVTLGSAQPGAALRLGLVAETSGSVVRLAGTTEGVAVGDTLSAATINGVVSVTPTNAVDRVTVEQHKRVRVGDFLADIDGWRQVPTPNSVAFVIKGGASEEEVVLLSRLDGLLLNDTVGLMSLDIAPASLISFRFETAHDLVLGKDEVLVVGPDRLRGESHSLFASVEGISIDKKRVALRPQGPLAAATLRPEDVSASVLFVKGSSLALIQKHELFVKWLAVGDSDAMPRQCVAAAGPGDDPCAGV